MTTISVIIPSHNRPELLREAITSVRHQTYKDWEVVIVDDGSDPPVEQTALRKEFGDNIRVIRNDPPMRLAYARDQGVQATKGDVVIQLDDDDLLAPHALEAGLVALESDPSLELVYLGVEGFGKNYQYFEELQSLAIQKVLKLADGDTRRPDIVRFGPKLFGALLQSVPMAFQRAIVYRSVWNKVSGLRRRVYMLDSDITDEEQARRRIQPPLRDSEWALYAAACCKTALLVAPAYLQRCDGQGYVSKPSEKSRAMHSSIDIKAHLFAASQEFTEFNPWITQIKNSYSQSYLNQAYDYFQNDDRLSAYKALMNAWKIRPKMIYLRFAMRMLLPRSNIPE